MSTATSFRYEYVARSLAGVPLILLLSAFAPPAKSPQPEIDKAARLARRARDTQNPADYRIAGAAADQALTVDADSFDAQRLRVVSLLGQQELAPALALATKLNKRSPDDVGLWAILSEVHAARGDYAEAERCAQWVLDLRRNNPLGFIAAARLREVFGDYDGAAEFYSEALRRTPQSDVEESSWLLTQSARLLLRATNLAAAATVLEQAEKLFPTSLGVMEQKAELDIAKSDFAGAAALLSRVSADSPTSTHLYRYAQALRLAGKSDEVGGVYQKLEANTLVPDSNMILYYADQKNNPEKALALASSQIALRQDASTLDAYAWALYRAGKFTEARTQVDKLLALGTRDVQFVCHAAQIAAQTKAIHSAASQLAPGNCEIR